MHNKLIFFGVLVKAYSIWPVRLQRIIKKAFSLCFLRFLLITYLMLSLGKEIILLIWKTSGKSLEFWIQKSVWTLYFAVTCWLQVYIVFLLIECKILIFLLSGSNKSSHLGGCLPPFWRLDDNPREKQLILFFKNVSWDRAEGNVKVQRKQN